MWHEKWKGIIHLIQPNANYSESLSVNSESISELLSTILISLWKSLTISNSNASSKIFQLFLQKLFTARNIGSEETNNLWNTSSIVFTLEHFREKSKRYFLMSLFLTSCSIGNNAFFMPMPVTWKFSKKRRAMLPSLERPKPGFGLSSIHPSVNN